MESETLELEGTWEEILAHSEELEGRWVYVRVQSSSKDTQKDLTPAAKRTLEWLEEWKNTPLTDEEVKILEDFERFRQDHPFSLRTLKEEL